MRTIFKLTVLAGLLFAGAAHGQEGTAEKTGFIRLVNAVAPGTGSLEVRVDGNSVNPDGYTLGDVTGGMPLKPGMHEVVIRREGTKEGSTKVSVAVDDTTTLIPFAERVPASDTEPAHWAIRILRLKQRDPESGRSATFVSVCQSPEVRVDIRDPEGNWAPVFVKRLMIAQAPILYPRGYVPLKSKDGKLESIPVADIGNYVVLLYQDEEDKVKSLNFRDYKFLSAD